MSIVLCRVDERLLHGQVVVGWGGRLEIGYYVIVDDLLAASEWEQDLYASGLPRGVDVFFLSEAEAPRRLPELDARPDRGALLTRGTAAMGRLAEAGLLENRRVNVGGIYPASERRKATDYVHLRPVEAEELRSIDRRSGGVTARDLPTSREITLEELLREVADE